MNRPPSIGSKASVRRRGLPIPAPDADCPKPPAPGQPLSAFDAVPKVALHGGRQRGDQLQTLVQMRDRLGERHALERHAARLLPERDRPFGLFRLGIVVRCWVLLPHLC